MYLSFFPMMGSHVSHAPSVAGDACALRCTGHVHLPHVFSMAPERVITRPQQVCSVSMARVPHGPHYMCPTCLCHVHFVPSHTCHVTLTCR